jgi:ATP/maltotriose-dependent transcriptional regulator MalT
VRAVVIEGEAGIGKSRLTIEACRLAEGLGFRVVWGACDEIERDRPLQALADLVDVCREVPESRGGERGPTAWRSSGTRGWPPELFGPVDAAWVVVESVLDALEDLASTSPVVLVVEDLQWADPLTLRVVHGIVRRLGRVPLAVVVTVRAGAHSADVDRAVGDLDARGAEHLVLRSLNQAEVVMLARSVADATPGPGLLSQVGRAGGNPLFVIELVRALRIDGALDVRNGVADAATVSSPPSLRLTLLRRLSQLPADTLTLLRVASVLGSSFAVADLARLASQTSAHLLSALGAAVDAGLLRESGDRLAFHHELVRDALYHDLPLAIRRSLHRDARAVLTEAGVGIERLVSHVVLGAEAGEIEAVTWLQQAATAVAPPTALRVFAHALELVDVDDPRRLAMEAEMVAPLIAVGRRREAEALARSVLAATSDAAVAVVARTGLAAVLSTGGRYPEALEELLRATLATPEPARRVLDAARSLLLVLTGDLDAGREVGQRAVEAGERDGDDYLSCQGRLALAIVALAQGYVGEAVTQAGRAVAAAEHSSAAWANSVVPHLWYGSALCDADRFDEAATALRTGQQRAEQSGNTARLPLYHWAIAEMRLNLGDWDDAVAEAQAGLDLVGDIELHVGDVLAHGVCAHVALHRGDLAAAQAAIDEAERRLVAGPVEIGFELIGWLAALLLQARGRPAHALARLCETWDLIAPVRYLQPTTRAMAPDLVRLAMSGGDLQRAASVTEELERSAERTATATARGLALRCRGLLDGDVGALTEAVVTHRQTHRPFLLAAACEDAGTALGRAGKIHDAALLLREAAAGYEQLDATWDAARVQSALRKLGASPRRRATRRPSFGWESLTPTELRIVELVVEGLTNPQIAERLYVSRRTVATHLEHVFQKLGHANRVELATEAAHRTR